MSDTDITVKYQQFIRDVYYDINDLKSVLSDQSQFIECKEDYIIDMVDDLHTKISEWLENTK